MHEELTRICQSCPTLVIHKIIQSCDGLIIKFLKEYAPDSDELKFFESRRNVR